MARRNWQADRIGLAAAGLALLAGTPAVLTVARVKNPWILAGATAAAAVVVVFSVMWQQRYQRRVQRRDEQDFSVQDGCLVLADGRLPFVYDISDPVMVGVHRAQAAAAAPLAGHALEAGAPAYVPRDVDAELRERLAAGGFVLLVGDSTAGKSRAAFEAIRGTLGDHVLIRPTGRDALGPAVGRAARERRCVLWLDDLEAYLGTGGLTAAQVGRLLTGPDHHRVIVATIRAAEEDRITAQAAADDDDDAGRQTASDVRHVLDQAHMIRMSRLFTLAELDRARTRAWDPRIADALEKAGSYGIAEYLAAGPDLLRIWGDARDSSQGPHARGAALVAAAIDIRLAGWTSLMPRDLLSQAHEHYLTGPEHAHTPREPLDEAWIWATRQRHATTALLRPDTADPDMVEVFDYLVDTIQRRDRPLTHIPEQTIRAAISDATLADANSIAEVAYAQGRYALAEHAFRRAHQAQASHPALGAEHPNTLISRNKLAIVLRYLGRLEEAEAEHRAVLEARIRVVGADHPDTLLSRNNLALVLSDLGRLEEAEAEGRAVLEARIRVLGADHPDTLTCRNNHAEDLRCLGRLEEAEAEHRVVVDGLTRALSPQHHATLGARGNLALVLHDLGRLEEAEAEQWVVVDGLTCVLGADHPDTLGARGNLALVLSDLGRLEEAEAEGRAVLEARTRVLGADHPDTLTCRNNHAEDLRCLGRLEEAEAEHRVVVDGLTRALGAEHPNTLACRDNHAEDLRCLGRLEEAEAEHRVVVHSSTHALGAEHPNTLACRNNHAEDLRCLGRLEEAQAEHQAVLEARTRVLGGDHPDTLTSSNNLSAAMSNLGDGSTRPSV